MAAEPESKAVSDAAFRFPVVDAHFHFWDAVSSPNPNLGGIVETHGVYQREEFLRDCAGLDLVRRARHAALAAHASLAKSQRRGRAACSALACVLYCALYVPCVRPH